MASANGTINVVLPTPGAPATTFTPHDIKSSYMYSKTLTTPAPEATAFCILSGCTLAGASAVGGESTLFSFPAQPLSIAMRNIER